jgi:hypothetical protein
MEGKSMGSKGRPIEAEARGGNNERNLLIPSSKNFLIIYLTWVQRVLVAFESEQSQNRRGISSKDG